MEGGGVWGWATDLLKKWWLESVNHSTISGCVPTYIPSHSEQGSSQGLGVRVHLTVFKKCFLEIFRVRLVTLLNTHFSHFKHTYTYFNTLFHSHVYQKHPKYFTQT